MFSFSCGTRRSMRVSVRSSSLSLLHRKSEPAAVKHHKPGFSRTRAPCPLLMASWALCLFSGASAKRSPLLAAIVSCQQNPTSSTDGIAERSAENVGIAVRDRSVAQASSPSWKRSRICLMLNRGNADASKSAAAGPQHVSSLVTRHTDAATRSSRASSQCLLNPQLFLSGSAA